MSDEHAAAREQQRELYGAPLADLVPSLATRLGLTRARLAEVLGLSAPMLSQLVSAQRVKIGNPAVVARLRSLLDLAESAGALSRAELDAAVAAVRSEQATLSGGRPADAARRTTLEQLRAAGDPEQLRAAAAALAPGSGLRRLLEDAAG